MLVRHFLARVRRVLKLSGLEEKAMFLPVVIFGTVAVVWQDYQLIKGIIAGEAVPIVIILIVAASYVWLGVIFDICRNVARATRQDNENSASVPRDSHLDIKAKKDS